jgi:hypothetical protein
VTRFDRQTFRNLDDGQCRPAGQQAGERALMLRRQMLNEDQGDIRVGRERFEELRERFETTGGCAHADYHGHVGPGSAMLDQV